MSHNAHFWPIVLIVNRPVKYPGVAGSLPVLIDSLKSLGISSHLSRSNLQFGKNCTPFQSIFLRLVKLLALLKVSGNILEWNNIALIIMVSDSGVIFIPYLLLFTQQAFIQLRISGQRKSQTLNSFADILQAKSVMSLLCRYSSRSSLIFHFISFHVTKILDWWFLERLIMSVCESVWSYVLRINLNISCLHRGRFAEWAWL